MSAYRRPVDEAALADNFVFFADADCVQEPLYAALSRAVAADRSVLELLMRAPYPQRRPVLLFAATHDVLLAGADHPVARHYRTLAGDAVDRDMGAAAASFIDFCRRHRGALAEALATRRVQTNEVGRSAGLRLALACLAIDRPIALIDVGCSAGLNLLVDRYRLAEDDDEATVVLRPELLGRTPPGDALPAIERRVGIDVAPLDVRDERDARWLRACIWPGDVERHARLSAALAIARDTTFDLRRGTVDDHLPGIVDALDDDVRPVVFHSWVVSYFDQAAKRRLVAALHELVTTRDGAWISAEGPGVVPGLAPPPLPDDATAAWREATVWHLVTRGATRVVARSHPHCRWIEWLGPSPTA